MDFNFEPAQKLYSSLRKGGKSREDALKESMDKFDLHRPVISGTFKSWAAETESLTEHLAKLKQEKEKIFKKEVVVPAEPVSEVKLVPSLDEETESAVEPWHEGSRWDSHRRKIG